jgi:hypothetical protein
VESMCTGTVCPFASCCHKANVQLNKSVNSARQRKRQKKDLDIAVKRSKEV